MRTAVLILPLLLAGLSGCYDGRQMIARILQRVSDDHRQEVDLGAYRVTLPRDGVDPVATTVTLEVVATIHKQNAREFSRQLKEMGAQLRHATILTLRTCKPEELLEPKLDSLHERIEVTTQKILTAAPIESIAFRSFAVEED